MEHIFLNLEKIHKLIQKKPQEFEVILIYENKKIVYILIIFPFILYILYFFIRIGYRYLIFIGKFNIILFI